MLMPVMGKMPLAAILVVISVFVAGCGSSNATANRNAANKSNGNVRIQNQRTQTYTRSERLAENVQQAYPGTLQSTVAGRDNAGTTVERAAGILADAQTEVINFDQRTETNAQQAQALSRVAAGIAGIDKAAVVLRGRTAIVGINITGDITDEKLTALKDEVQKALLQADPNLKRVAVTASGELVERITRLSGRGDWNTEEFNRNANDIIQRIVPTI